MLPSKSITPFLGNLVRTNKLVRSVLFAYGKTAVNEEKVLRAIARPRSSAFTARTSMILRVRFLVKSCPNHYKIGVFELLAPNRLICGCSFHTVLSFLRFVY